MLKVTMLAIIMYNVDQVMPCVLRWKTIVIQSHNDLTTGVDIEFQQSAYTVAEGDIAVEVCATTSNGTTYNSVINIKRVTRSLSAHSL